jgi:antitoxin HigA-1
MTTRMRNPPHPGRQLKEALENIPATVEEFAAKIGANATELHKVVNCEAPITEDLSARISREFGQSSPDLWSKMQAAHDEWHGA